MRWLLKTQIHTFLIQVNTFEARVSTQKKVFITANRYHHPFLTEILANYSVFHIFSVFPLSVSFQKLSYIFLKLYH